MLIIVLLVIDPPHVLLATFGLYVLSGPVMTLVGRVHRRRRRSAARGEPPAA